MALFALNPHVKVQFDSDGFEMSYVNLGAYALYNLVDEERVVQLMTADESMVELMCDDSAEGVATYQKLKETLAKMTL